MYPEQAPLRPRPWWLEEGELPWRLLERVLSQLERGQRLTLRIKRKTAPELFDAEHHDTDYLWELVRSLDKEFHVFSIELEPTRADHLPYDNALLRFNPEKEALVRHWLERPALDPYALVWRHQLERMRDRFEDDGRALEERIVRVPQHGAEAVLRAFACLGPELDQPVTLRGLSARCFWGDSKFLDHEEDLVRALYPGRTENLLPRPILVNVVLPARLEQVLFVENQDAFLALKELAPPGIALVHGAGFRGGAPRIRQSGHSEFGYLDGGGDGDARLLFERWWFRGAEQDCDLECWFWGDLDFAGMGILAAMRRTFPRVRAWEPGYRVLLERLEKGWGHARDARRGEPQTDPDVTGCEYADLTLLPALRDRERFVDQEAVRVAEIGVN